jgi:hypothetical protein
MLMMLSEFPSEVEWLILEYVSDIVKKRNGRFVMQLNKKTDVRFATVALSCHGWDIYQSPKVFFRSKKFNHGLFTIRYYDAINLTFDIQFMLANISNLQSFGIQSMHYGFIDEALPTNIQRLEWDHVSLFCYKDGSVREIREREREKLTKAPFLLQGWVSARDLIG